MVAYDPFFGTNPVVSSMQAERGRREQIRENTARLAQSYISLVTTGVGRILIPDIVKFDLTFVERPIISYGFSLIGATADADLPSCTGGVLAWEQNSRGFWTGAWIVVNVDTASAFEMVHDFTFTGVAMKDFPEVMLDAAEVPPVGDL